MASERSVVVPLPPVHWGGLQAFAANMNDGLRQAGWRWTVLVPPEASDVHERLRDAGVLTIPVPLVRFRKALGLTARCIISLPNNIRSLAALPGVAQAHIVQAVGAHHCHGPLLARSLAKPLVWQLHSDILPAPIRRLIAPVISASAHSIMTNGTAIARAFWNRSYLGPNHFVFYAPVDTSRYMPDCDLRNSARRELNCDCTTVLVGTVGNRVWQKNHPFLVRAAARLTHLYPKLRFLILGGDSDSFRKQYAETVERPAALLNQRYPEYIRFIQPGRDVHRWMAALDVFTLTSHAEGVPIALFEAMSTAKPVVAVNVGSISEIVEEGTTGYLFSPNDMVSFTAHITTLYESSTLRTSMGDMGRAHIREAFSLNSVVLAHTTAYEYALRNAPAA